MSAELHYIRKLIMQSLQQQQNKFICCKHYLNYVLWLVMSLYVMSVNIFTRDHIFNSSSDLIVLL